MTSKAQQALENAQSRYSEISVGDSVIATPDGSYFVSAYIWEVNEDTIVYRTTSDVMFDCPRELAEEVTILLSKYADTPRYSIIQEILDFVA